MDQNNTLHRQILERMQEKETDELLSIWDENDHSAWTDEAFSVVEQILKERLGEVPPQTPDYGPGMPRSASEEIEKAAEDEEYNQTDLRFRRIGFYAKVLSYLVLGGAAAINVFISFGWLRQAWPLTQTFAGSVGAVLLVSAVSLIFYVLLQFVTQGVNILLEIRDNTSE